MLSAALPPPLLGRERRYLPSRQSIISAAMRNETNDGDIVRSLSFGHISRSGSDEEEEVRTDD